MICDNCLHKEVCGCEGAFEEALTYCKDFMGWIPVKEKLPDPEDVIVTVREGMAYVTTLDCYSLVEYEGFEGYGKDVVAWMPLPQPYKGESEE